MQVVPSDICPTGQLSQADWSALGILPLGQAVQVTPVPTVPAGQASHTEESALGCWPFPQGMQVVPATNPDLQALQAV